jgi:hypothetical protein
MEKNMTSGHPARKLEHKMYGLYKILDIILPMGVDLCLAQTWKIKLVVQVSLIDPFLKGNHEVDLNVGLKTSDPIETACEYDLDKAMGSTENDRSILYLVKCKGWPAKKQWTREPVDSITSIGAKEELRVFYLKNLDTLRNSCLINAQ